MDNSYNVNYGLSALYCLREKAWWLDVPFWVDQQLAIEIAELEAERDQRVVDGEKIITIRLNGPREMVRAVITAVAQALDDVTPCGVPVNYSWDEFPNRGALRVAPHDE